MNGYPPRLVRAFKEAGISEDEALLAERRLHEHSQFVTLTFVNTYLVLNEEEHAEWRGRLIRMGELEVDSNGKTWADRLVLKGLREGMQEAAIEMQEGAGLSLARKISRDLGRMMGYARSAREIKAAVLQRQIAARFGHVPRDLVAQLATANEDLLDRLLDRVVTAADTDVLMSAIAARAEEGRA